MGDREKARSLYERNESKVNKDEIGKTATKITSVMVAKIFGGLSRVDELGVLVNKTLVCV